MASRHLRVFWWPLGLFCHIVFSWTSDQVCIEYCGGPTLFLCGLAALVQGNKALWRKRKCCGQDIYASLSWNCLNEKMASHSRRVNIRLQPFYVA